MTVPNAVEDAVTAWARGVVDVLDREYLFQHCSVHVASAAGERLRLAAQRSGSGIDRSLVVPDGWASPVDRSVVGRAFRTASPILVMDADLDPEYLPYSPARGRSQVAVPVIVDGAAVAVLTVESARVAAFRIADVEQLVEVARAVAAAFPR